MLSPIKRDADHYRVPCLLGARTVLRKQEATEVIMQHLVDQLVATVVEERTTAPTVTAVPLCIH